MDTIHQRMYAYLLCRVDAVLQMIANALYKEKTGREVLYEVGEHLKNAVLYTEEMYVEEEEIFGIQRMNIDGANMLEGKYPPEKVEKAKEYLSNVCFADIELVQTAVNLACILSEEPPGKCTHSPGG